MTRADLGKTIAALVCVIGVIVLWVICLRMLIGYAGSDDPGAYVMVGGVFLMLPAAAVILVVALRSERSGRWERGGPTQAEEPAETVRVIVPVFERAQ